MNKSLFKKIILAILFFVFFALSVVTILLVRSAPKISGEIKNSDLINEVIINRDSYGVPHIKAKNDHDLFYSLGFLMASERWFQMEMHRRVARGELSEVVGPKALPVDKLYRTLDFVGHFRKVLAQNKHPHEMKLQMDAFFKGVNHYILNYPKPIEFYLLGMKPREFSKDDSYAFIGYMAYSFGIGIRQDSFFSKVKAKIENQFFEDMRNEPDQFFQKLSNVDSALEILLQGFSPLEGSNGWLLGPSRTKSKRAMLANDPHISFSKPNLWMEAHLITVNEKQQVQKNEYGYFLPLIPFPTLYHSPDKAWGLTMSMSDDMDLLRLAMVDEDSYELDGEKRVLEMTPVEIKIKGDKPYQFNRKVSYFGPVLDQVLDQEEKAFRNISLHWSLYKPHNDPILSFYLMKEAANMNEFRAAVSTGVAPGMNVLYADKENNIAWWMFGEFEKKPNALLTDQIMEGDKKSKIAHEVYAFLDLPHAENPTSGIIASANQRPDGLSKSIRGDFQPNDRYQTILTLLEKKSDWTVDEIEKIQSLPLNLRSQSVLRYLLSFLNEENSKRLTDDLKMELTNWNGLSDKEERAPLLYYSWLRSLSMNFLELNKLSKDEANYYSQFTSEWSFLKRKIDSLDVKNESDQKLVNKSFQDALSFIEENIGGHQKNWKWGAMHTIEFSHPLGAVKPLNYFFNDGPHAASGAYQEIDNMKWGQFIDGFKIKAGPSVRRIIDFGQIERARAVLPLGISGHELSKYKNNQRELFLNGGYRETNLTLSEFLKANHSESLRMSP